MPAGPWAGKVNLLGTPDVPTELLGGGLVLILATIMPKVASILKLRQ
jgi:hypothetical protein